MVSLRKSDGGLVIPGTAGIGGASPAPGTGGKAGFNVPGMAGAGGLGRAEPPGTAGTGGLGNPGTPGNVGLGGGVSRIVSFFNPGGGGETGAGGLGIGVRRTVSFFTTGAGGVGDGAIGGLTSGAPADWGGLRPVGKEGAPGGLGGLGGKGTPFAI